MIRREQRAKVTNITDIGRRKTYSKRQKELRRNLKPGVFGNYAFVGRGKRDRTLIRLEDIYLRLRSSKEGNKKSLALFHGWVFVNSIIALSKGANK